MRTTPKITKKEKEIQIIDNKHPLIFDLLTIYVWKKIFFLNYINITSAFIWMIKLSIDSIPDEPKRIVLKLFYKVRYE